MSKTRVLIVDDDDAIRNGCQLLLKDEGYSVMATSDPREGLRLVKEENFPIVFVDYKMPEMTGIEFLRQVRQQNPNTDVVMITGYASIEMAIDAIRLGAYDYIQKPFLPDKILAAYFIEKHSRRKGVHAVKSISAEALGAMQNYSWPGNVREMENVIERAVIIEDSEEI